MSELAPSPFVMARLAEELPRIRAARSESVKQACAEGLRELKRAAARAFRPTRRIPPSEWIREHMRLDDDVEAGAGRYDIERRPWWIPILDSIDDPEVRMVSIAAATQIGKTLSLIALILWAAENDPAPMMLVTPDRDTAIELRNRIYANARATIRAGGCRHLRVPPEHKWNSRHVDLGACRLYLSWSQSRQRLRGRPAKRIFLTEVAVYARGVKAAGDPIAAAHQRCKAFFRSFIYQESSPGIHPCRITELEQQATARYRWNCKCPHCGHAQELRFFPFVKGELAEKAGIGGIKDDGGEYVSPDLARTAAYYVCEKGCRIDNGDKQTLLESGRMDPVGKPAGRRKLGFHLWSIHAEQISFGDLAAAYVEARRQLKVAEWWGNWLGLEYKPQSRVPEWHKFGESNASYNGRGQVPREAWFLTAMVDVQGENNGVRVSVRGWAPGRTSWLVDWRWLEREPGDDNWIVCSDLAKVTREILERRYPVIDADGNPALNPLGKRDLAVKLLGIDVGHLPRKVNAWLHSLPESWIHPESGRVRPLRGDHQLNPDIRFQPSQWEQNVRTGEKYEDGGMVVWRVNAASYWDVLTQLLCAEPHKPGGFHVTADCLTKGRAYLEQVVNFGKSIKVDPDTGAKKTIWSPRNTRVPVDFFDTEVGNLVCSEMILGSIGWNQDAWEAWLAEQQPAQPNSKAKRPQSLSDRDLGGLDDR